MKCYECDSDVDDRCLDTFKNKTIAKCTGVACFKSKLKIKGEIFSVRRGCMKFREQAIGCKSKRGGFNFDRCSCNDKDFCNSGNNLNMSNGTILISYLIYTIYNRFTQYYKHV